MKFKKLFLVLALGLLFFGCIDLGTANGETDNGNDGSINGDNGNGNGGTVIIGNGTTGGVNGGTHNGDNGETNNGSVNGGTVYDPTANLNIYFLDLQTDSKQSESILVKKGKYEMLIDAGPGETGQEVVNFLEGKVNGEIEILVLSHDDEEHWGGAGEVIDNFDIGEIWWNGDTYSEEYGGLIDKIEAKGIPFVEVKVEDVFDINGAEAYILNPPKQKFLKANSDSVSMKLSYGDFCILLLSDTVQGAQSKMIDEYENQLQCEVMQVPYHGLGAGNTQLNLLLKKVKPEIGIMTGNDKLLPTETSDRAPTYQQLEWEDVQVYETFDGGTIKVTVNVIDDTTTYQVSYIQ